MKAKKLMSVILSLCMVLSVIQVTSIAAFAGEEVSYLYPVYNKTDGTFYENCSSGIKEWKTGSYTSYVAVTSDDTTWGTAGTESWYVASGKVEINHSVTIAGTVNLVLADYATLTITGSSTSGIANYGEGNNFIVYAQSTGENMGTLLVTGGQTNFYSYAGIESTGDATVTINGGHVTAKSLNRGAGIGGGANGADGSNITINGGDVTAENSLEAAGIGGGINGNGANITINGGNVIAKGGTFGAGIGGGGCNNTGDNIRRGGDCTCVTINGGDVEAETPSGCGIGSGICGNCSFISITGGTVRATSKNNGIGASAVGVFEDFGGIAHDITISGGTVIATSTGGGCGIGGESSHSEELGFHHYANVYDITISGEDTSVTAIGCADNRCGGAGIGTYKGGDVKNITIKDGCTVIATGYGCAPGIGSGSVSGEIFGTTSDITISGEGTKVIATAGSETNGAPGIGSCAEASNITISGAEVYATGSGVSAGIGSGYYGDASGITLSDCKVTAITGSDFGAGIGAGYCHSASDITITNSTVTAKGGNDAAGIGGGKGGNATNITISGDSFITAIGGNSDGAAIGAGKGGTATDITVDASLFIAANEDETLSEYNAICDTRTSDDDISGTLSATSYAGYPLYRCAVIKPRDAYVAQVGEGDTAVKYLFVQTAIDKVIKELSYLRKEGNSYYIDETASANFEVGEHIKLDNVTITMIADSFEEIDIPYIAAGIYIEDWGCYSNDAGLDGAYLCQNITLDLDGHVLSAFFDSGESVVSIGKNQTLTVKDGRITGASPRRWDQDKIDICCGIYNDGTFNMTSGTITGNTANGGVYNNGTMTVGGTAVIEGNTLNDETVQNLYLTSGKKVVISSETPFVEGANIGITTATKPTSGSPVEFATSATKNDEKNDEDYFFSDSTAYVDKYYYAGTALDLVLGNRVTALESEGGSVSVGNQKSAYDGEKVKVKATPDEGYALDEVTIKKAEDSTDITENVGYDETTGTFTMPAYEVTVEATFTELPEAVKNATYATGLTLSKSIALNFQMSGLGSGFTKDNLTIKVDGSDKDFDYDETTGTVSCVIASDSPNKIGESHTISVTYDNVEIKNYSYSAKDYCNAILKSSDYGESSKEGVVCKALLNYGKYTEDYVNGNTASTINEGYAIDFADYEVTGNGEVAEAGNYADSVSASLALGSTIKLRFTLTNCRVKLTNADTKTQNFYILNTDEKQIDPKYVTVETTDGTTAGRYNITVSVDLNASRLATSYALKLKGVSTDDFEITYGVYSYCNAIVNDSDYDGTTLATLCKSIHNYGQAVQDYIK